MMNRSSCFHRRFLFSVCGSFFLSVLLGPIVAQSATYYVSLSGSDSNPGTSSKPFRTFKRAAQPLRPGDTLYIRGGLWTEQINLQSPSISGTSSGYIRIAGYPGEKITIRYAEPLASGYGPIKARGTRGYLIFENFVLDGINGANKSGINIVSGNHHFILRNLEIKNFRYNGLYIGANDIQVINCTIHHQISVSGQSGERWYGIYLHHGSNGLLQGNKIYNNPGGGLHLYPGPLPNLVVRSNAVYSNNKLASSAVGGIILYGSSSSRISNAKIYDNRVYNNGTSSSGSANGIRLVYTTGTKVLNNTVSENKTYGLLIASTNSNTVVQNNVLTGNGAGNYYNSGAGTIYTP